MGKIIKLLGIVVGAVIALFIVAVVAVALFFDPNDYKDQIVTAVNEATGRELTLEGDLELALFPRIAIALGPATISNAPGFGAEPFARIETARLQLELFPLLARRVEVGRAELRGLALNLARDARGANNWQDLAGADAAPATEAAPAAEPAGAAEAISLDVGAIEIADAAVSWTDAAAGTRWQLDRFNLSAANFGPGVVFPLAIDFALAGAEVAVEVEARMQAALDIAGNRYRLEDLEVGIAGEGAAWPGGSGDVTLRSALFDVDLDGETVAIEQLALDVLGLAISGDVTGSNIVSNLALRGTIEIAEFNPIALLERFDAAIETADPAVLRSATVRAALVHDARQSMLDDLELTLDDSRMTGRAGLQGETLSFDIAIDSIDVDRYLPPAEEGEASQDEGSLDEVDLPLDALRSLSANGQLAIAAAKFMGLSLADARFALTAANGTLRLTPQANLYGGSYGGAIGIVVGQDSARIDLEQNLDGVDMLALGRDFLGSEMVSGTGRVRLDLVGNGANLGDVRRGLDGDVAFSLTDGAWQGMDLWYELRRARAVLDGNPAPAREGPRETAFSEVSATGVIEDAVLVNRDLRAALPFMQVTGSGSANLITDALDFDLTARFIDGPAIQADPAMASLAGAELPFTVGGTLTAPSVRPDFGAVLRSRVQSELQERQTEVEQEVEERVEERTDELRERLQDRVRGLFNR